MGDAAMYGAFNDAMRALVGRQRTWQPVVAGQPAQRSRRCNTIGVLDLPTLMNYSAASGECIGGNPMGGG
eukprot:6138912-Prymnesium_polylepis.1